MKKANLFLLAVVLAAAAWAQDQNCPECGADVKSIYSGGVFGEARNSSAPGLSIGKAAPAKIIKGDVLPVSIEVTNGLSSDVTVTLKETFGGAEPVDMNGFIRTMPDITSAPPYYKMIIDLGAGEKKTLAYKIKPLYYGKYKIPGTEASTSTEKKKSNAVTVMVSCDENNACEPEKDENALTCPHDCKPDQKDELCDPMQNGVCDPDCAAGEDPDCGAAATTTRVATTLASKSCGNKVCEQGKNESSANCPSDCPPGARDGYCDSVSDGKCDPDCGSSADPDCGRPTDTGIVYVLFFAIIVIVLAAFYAKRWMKKR